MKIDAKDAYSFKFHALFPFGNTKIPARLWVVLIPDGNSVLGFTCQAPESENDGVEPTLTKIINSFHRKSAVATTRHSRSALNKDCDFMSKKRH
jgi:hypothetical protein